MDIPFAIARSTVIKGLEWCGPRIPYAEPDIKGDTYPMTWADDGEIYMEADGLTGWLQFSGSWSPTGQAAGFYRSNVRRFRLNMA